MRLFVFFVNREIRKMEFTIHTTLDGTAAMLSLEGWLDSLSAVQLQQAIDGLPDEICDLAFDCQKLEYVSSAGLRRFALTQKKLSGKGSFLLIHVSEDVLSVLQMTGLAERLQII